MCELGVKKKVVALVSIIRVVFVFVLPDIVETQSISIRSLLKSKITDDFYK